jgi:transcriptional regulator with XRE-family HTH domain
MPGQVEQIAERIKELREIAGISPESLAKEIRLSPEAYRGYESGAVDIPIGVLYEVAGYFKIELTELLTGEAPRLSKYCLVRKEKGVAVERRSPYRYLSLAYNFIRKKAEPFLVTVEAGPEDRAVSLNSHAGQEFNYVLEGKLMLVIDGTELVLEEGDSIYFDSSASHGMKALGGGRARFLAIIL